jgi:His-Xaa-Ser system protein HxsD
MVSTIDLRTYRLAAVKKAAYRIADRVTVVLGVSDGERLQVEFLFTQQTSEHGAAECIRLFFEELLDQELLEHVAEETAPVRALLLAQAFSRTDLIRR